MIKHDGGKVFHADVVRKLLNKWGVTDLTTPRTMQAWAMASWEKTWPGIRGRVVRVVLRRATW